jgi:pantoate--beta-alanine ligase
VLIERMCSDLDVPVDVVIAPTVRAEDGLALSSRNSYLDESERASALQLVRALRVAREAYQQGERDPAVLVKAAAAVLALDARVRPQYIELVDAATLTAPTRATDQSVMAVAAYVGSTRLIDNMSMAE